jgi:hypothetical protein
MREMAFRLNRVTIQSKFEGALEQRTERGEENIMSSVYALAASPPPELSPVGCIASDARIHQQNELFIWLIILPNGCICIVSHFWYF